MILAHRIGVMIACDGCPEHQVYRLDDRAKAEAEGERAGWSIERDRKGNSIKHLCAGCAEDARRIRDGEPEEAEAAEQ